MGIRRTDILRLAVPGKCGRLENTPGTVPCFRLQSGAIPARGSTARCLKNLWFVKTAALGRRRSGGDVQSSKCLNASTPNQAFVVNASVIVVQALARRAVRSVGEA